MDPTACMNKAEQAARDLDLEAVIEALHDYAEWKLNGGFSSDRDDARYEALFSGLNLFGDYDVEN